VTPVTIPTMGRLTVLALVATFAAVGCGSEEPQAGDSAASCGMPFAEYSVGGSFEGIDVVSRQANCGKRPSVTYVYGTCHATSDTGCAPPLQVQTWSACHRKRSRAPAGHDVELSRGEVTVVVFARSDGLAHRAARAIRKARTADPALSATNRLRACGAQ
jgi:hypothetical protein